MASEMAGDGQAEELERRCPVCGTIVDRGFMDANGGDHWTMHRVPAGAPASLALDEAIKLVRGLPADQRMAAMSMEPKVYCPLSKMLLDACSCVDHVEVWVEAK